MAIATARAQFTMRQMLTSSVQAAVWIDTKPKPGVSNAFYYYQNGNGEQEL